MGSSSYKLVNVYKWKTKIQSCDVKNKIFEEGFSLGNLHMVEGLKVRSILFFDVCLGEDHFFGANIFERFFRKVMKSNTLCFFWIIIFTSLLHLFSHLEANDQQLVDVNIGSIQFITILFYFFKQRTIEEGFAYFLKRGALLVLSCVDKEILTWL